MAGKKIAEKSQYTGACVCVWKGRGGCGGGDGS